MHRRTRALHLLPSLLLLTALASAARADTRGQPPSRPPTLRVLMVGNSYSMFNDLPRMLEEVAASVPTGPELHVDIAFKGGVGLRVHWQRGVALRMLHAGHYTDVVLQGHSRAAFDRPTEMLDYAARFAREAQKVGAKPILFETWARAPASPLYKRGKDAKNPLDMQKRIDALYGRAARRIGARIAPVGDAWLAALEQWPHLHLHLKDDSHPSRRGSYLTACVLYGVLTGHSPQEVRYPLPGTSPTVLERLRAAAAETLQHPGTPADTRIAAHSL